MNSFAPINSTNELKIEISDKDEDDNNEIKNNSVIERGSVLPFNENDSKNVVEFDSDDDFESLDQEQETRRTHVRKVNSKESNIDENKKQQQEATVDQKQLHSSENNKLSQIENKEKSNDNKLNETQPITTESKTKESFADENKEEEKINKLNDTQTVSTESKNETTKLVVTDQQKASSTVDENRKQETKSVEEKEKESSNINDKKEQETKSVKEKESPNINEKKEQETKSVIESPTKKSVSKSKPSNYNDDIERKLFVLPKLPFSMNPVHFTFESLMKYDDSLKAPQFKALPVPKIEMPAESVNENKLTENKEKPKEDEKERNNQDLFNSDDFGIIDAFQSIQSSPPVQQNRLNQNELVVEKPIIAENIEDMKCFSIFKSYLES